MESVQTQQQRDRQTRLERRRQQEWERRARETPEERDRRRSIRNQRDRERRRARCAARCASALAQLERVCTCIIIIIRIRIYIRELAHARPPMSCISLVLYRQRSSCGSPGGGSPQLCAPSCARARQLTTFLIGHVHHENRPLIQSRALMRSAIILFPVQ